MGSGMLEAAALQRENEKLRRERDEAHAVAERRAGETYAVRAAALAASGGGDGGGRGYSDRSIYGGGPPSSRYPVASTYRRR